VKRLFRFLEIARKSWCVKDQKVNLSWHRNWATIRDISVVKASGGWDLYLGPECHLCRAHKEREVFDFAAAFVQLQHDEAWYVEDVPAFILRVGMDYVRERVVKDVAGRNILLARFMRVQRSNGTAAWSDEMLLALVNEAKLRRSAS